MSWVNLGYRFLGVVGAAVLGSALLARSPSAAQDASAEPSSPQFYATHVQPILRENCYRCHAGMLHRGGLQLDSPEAILRGGKNGPVIVPGSPAQSLLVKLIRHEGPADDPMPMPPKSMLSDGDIATVTAWVKAGAVMPHNANQ